VEKKDLILSASRIKTLETCSWTYWCNYHLKLPEKQNSGASRGTICHLVFELLSDKKHSSHYKKIIKDKTIKNNAAIFRLVSKHAKKLNVDSEENMELIDKMIIVGLANDFFLENAELGKPEQEFLIDNESPKYKIRGFIDKHGFYKKDKTLKIADYKSSKAKFKGEELNANLQALTYTLAVRKSPDFKHLSSKVQKVITEFIFLRFPKQPIQNIEISDEQLAGYEKYLEYVYSIASDFDEETAVSNLAAHSEEKKWMCKAGATWVCPYYHPFPFVEVYDENKVLKKTYFVDDLPKNLPEGWSIKRKKYTGCPAHNS
jgi:ATP-dependent helicase/DNAse subunit B